MMRSWFHHKKTGLIISLILGGIFCQGWMASNAQPLSSTSLDDLFLLDAPPSVQTIMHPATPIYRKPAAALKTLPKKEAIAYLATTTTTANLPTVSNQWQPAPSNQPTLEASVGLSTQALLKISRAPELLLALQRMSYTPTARTSLNALLQRGGRVMFKNLAELGSQYATFDALAWLSKDPAMEGTWVLFIAEKHRKAPAEALASLITHEALHSDFQNSYCEEEQAWLAEVTAWKAFKAQNPTLQHIPKGWYGLVDRLNTIEMALAQQTLKTMIRNNPGYAGLQEASPYFRYSPFATQEVDGSPPSLGTAMFTQKVVTPVVEPSKPLPVATTGRPKLTLRPLKAW